ncbi:MAG: isocitrate/isopropylmalate family dehydrogenase [Candidatus Bathyarchaeota archaeon]|nr:isocitrate/isopropylmalate family dehydrogenase [Candidatus Bathyarchaeota archaeon]
MPGDGIGPEVTVETVKVLKATGANLKLFNVSSIGEAYTDSTEGFLTDSSLYKCEAILIGAIGRDGELRDALSRNVISHFYREKQVYANVRPFKSIRGTPGVKRNSSTNEVDVIIIRDSSEGFSRNHRGYSRGTYGVDKRIISDFGAKRIAKFSFEYAVKNKRSHITCVDQSNWLHSDKIFRKSFIEVSKRYPSVTCDCLHVDVAAMMVSRSPEEFDVFVTPNMYGDILSGIVIGQIGGIGLAPSAYIGDNFAVFEPVHGMAWDIVGKGEANPIASIRSARLMLEWFGMHREAWLIGTSVSEVLTEGEVLTRDLGGSSSTEDVGSAIAEKILVLVAEQGKFGEKLLEMTEKKMTLEHMSIKDFNREDIIIEDRDPYLL